MRFNPAITILGMKKQIAATYEEAFGKLETDEEINESMEFNIMDNLPKV